MTRILHREDLDSMECAVEGCDHTGHDGLWFHASCHMDAPLGVEYNSKTGIMRFWCGECGHHVASIAVAEEKAKDDRPI